MTKYYLVANNVGNGGSFSPRDFNPCGIFESIANASRYILTLDNFHELSIIVLDSEERKPKNNLSETERKFNVQNIFFDVQVPTIIFDDLLYFVTSTSHVDMGQIQSFYPQFSLNFHGIFNTQVKAQNFIDNMEDVKTINAKYSSLPIVSKTKLNPEVTDPIAIRAQHFDFNLLTNTFSKPYMLTVKYEHLDEIRTSVLESIHPYFAYTNIDPSIENIDEYAQKLVSDNRVQVLQNAASLIFTARNWSKEELKKYLFTKLNEEDNLIYFHLIDYPDKKTVFDDKRMYMSQQLICNYINKQEKAEPRLDEQAQQVILDMLVSLHPYR
jgi:hypothetical protein